MATARPLAIVDELLATVDYLRITVGDAEPTGLGAVRAAGHRPGRARRAWSARPGPSGGPTATTWRRRCSSRATRSASPPWRSASWLLAGSRARRVAGDVSIALGRGRPNGVNLPSPAAIADGRDRAPTSTPRSSTATSPRSSTRPTARAAVGAALLWGNVAASCASSFGAVAGGCPARRVEIRDRAEEFFAHRPARDPRRRPPGARRRRASRGSGAAAASGTGPSRRGMCEDCSLRPSVRPRGPLRRHARRRVRSDDPAAASGPTPSRDPEETPMPDVTPTTSPPTTPARRRCAGRRRWCSSTPGPGKGKTSAAMGVVIRGVGRGWPVAVVQFLKSGNWHTGEEKVCRQLGVDWWAMGEGFTWDSADLAVDQAVAAGAWDHAKRVIQRRRPPARRARRDHVPDQLGLDRPSTTSSPRSPAARPTSTSSAPAATRPPRSSTSPTRSPRWREVKHAYEAGIRAKKGIDY